jgi:hypothetical protein
MEQEKKKERMKSKQNTTPENVKQQWGILIGENMKPKT